MEPTIIPILNAQQQGMSSWAHGVNVLPEMAQANAQNLALQMLKQQKEQIQAPEESGPLSGFRQREGETRNHGGNRVMENGKRSRKTSRKTQGISVPAKILWWVNC